MPTSATILPVRPNGERLALHVPGSAAHFTVAQEDEAAALDARFVHIGGTGLLKAFDGEPTRRLIAAAKALGRTTTFDLIQANPETWALVEPLLPHVDYFIPSIDEAAELAGRSDPDEAARFFLDRGVGTCAITLAGEGVLIRTADGSRLRWRHSRCRCPTPRAAATSSPPASSRACTRADPRPAAASPRQRPPSTPPASARPPISSRSRPRSRAMRTLEVRR
ncbi:MAG: PfkB family carbohydrate kinase [Geminicoccaceae bacterium]